MFRKKGWSHRYDRMNREDVRSEQRRLERANYVHDKEAKLSYLAGLPKVVLTAVRHGSMTYVSGPVSWSA